MQILTKFFFNGSILIKAYDSLKIRFLFKATAHRSEVKKLGNYVLLLLPKLLLQWHPFKQNPTKFSSHPRGQAFFQFNLVFFQLFWRKKFAAKRKTNLWAGGEVRNFCKQVQANVPGTGNKVSICSNIRRNRVNSWQQGTTVSKQGTKCWITKECYCATARFWAREKMIFERSGSLDALNKTR